MNALFVWLLGAGELGLGAAILALLALTWEGGYRLGRRRGQAGDATAGAAALTAGMASLLAFILGLTLNFAENRYESRRDLVTQEANAISTAWLRARLVGQPEAAALDREIRAYATTRLAFVSARPSEPIDALTSRTEEEQQHIWALAASAAQKSPTPITASLVTALNEMFDLAQSQRFAFLGEAPGNMLEAMLGGAILAIGALGYEAGMQGRRQLFLTVLLLVMWTGAMVLTIDLLRPRLGAMRADQRPLAWTVEEMAHTPPPAVAP